MITVLRPDGLLGHVAGLDGFGRVVAYLEGLIVPQEIGAAMNGHATRKELGEFLSENENNLAMPIADDVVSKEVGMVAR